MFFDLDSRDHASSLSATEQPEFSQELEDVEDKNAEVMPNNKPFIAHDRCDVPILAYFPQVLESTTVAATYHALNEYVTATSFSKEATTESQRDQRHAFSQKLFDLFGPRHGLRHCGMWHATGHPHGQPSVSKKT